MSKLIFVTGASGFLAAHIIHQLIEKGHRIRATARGKKVQALQGVYNAHPSVEIVEVADIASSQFGDSLKGVDAVIHTATPLPGRGDADTIVKTAIDGSLNVLRQAEQAGVKKFIVTGSIAAVVGDPSAKAPAFRAEHWIPLTKADAASGVAMQAYQVAKKYSELAVWEWAEAHPHVDVTTIVPPYMYGPFAPIALPIAPGDWISFSTNINISKLLDPNGMYPQVPPCVDIRDVARAHIAALDAPSSVQGRKRILIASPHGVVFKDIMDMIKEERPAMEGRLTKASFPEFPFTRFELDFGRIQEVLGIKIEDFHTTKQTFLDAIDSVLEVEKAWKEQGYTFEGVPETFV